MSLNTDTTMQVVPAYNGGGGFGNFADGSWFIIILFLFAFLGWGNGGYGGGGVQENYVLTSDFAQVERKLDGIANGICDSTFALNNAITNGFSVAELSKANQQSALMERLANMSAQAADCCCKTQTNIADLKYTVSNGTRDVVENQNANTRAILDAITANRIEDKNNQIAMQNQKIFQLELAASQSAQNAYLIDQLGYHCPKAAYVVQPPQPVTFPNGGCNCGYNNI